MKKSIIAILGLLLVGLFAVSVQAASVTCDIRDQHGEIIPESVCQFILGGIVGTATSGNSIDLADGTYVVRYQPAIFANDQWRTWADGSNVRKQSSLIVRGDITASETFDMSTVRISLRDQNNGALTEATAYFQFAYGAIGTDSILHHGDSLILPQNDDLADSELIGSTSSRGGYGFIIVSPEYEWSSSTLGQSKHAKLTYLGKWKKLVLDEDQEVFGDVWPHFKGKVGLYGGGSLVDGSRVYYNAISTMYNDDELKLPSNDPSIEGIGGSSAKGYYFSVFPGDQSESGVLNFFIYGDGRLEPNTLAVGNSDYSFSIGEPAQPPIVDNDEDGHAADVDCNDNDATVYPGASELACDFVDNDCNGLVDESVAAPMADLSVDRLEKNVLPVGKYQHASLYSVQSDFTVACGIAGQNLVLSACDENVNIGQNDILLVTSAPGKGKNAAACGLQRIAVDTLNVAAGEAAEKDTIEVWQVSNGIAALTTSVTDDHNRTATATTSFEANGHVAPIGHQITGQVVLGSDGTQVLLVVALVAIVAIVAMAYGAVNKSNSSKRKRR